MNSVARQLTLSERGRKEREGNAERAGQPCQCQDNRSSQQSKQATTDRTFLFFSFSCGIDSVQSQTNEKIRIAESNFSSVSSVEAQVQMVETQITDLEESKSRLEQEIREAKYDERIREKTVSIRQKETDRDRANSELSALNRQADSRAQLTIKRNELTSKNSQVTASSAYIILIQEKS